MIEEVCEGTVVQLIVNKLASSDVNVQVPALKATANLLMCEEPEIIVDKALFEGVLDKLVALAQQDEFKGSSQVLQEICFAISNVAAGTQA